MFYWDAYQLNVDRHKVWIGTTDQTIDPAARRTIANAVEAVAFYDHQFTFNLISSTTEPVDKSLNIAYLDMEKLTFPLTLRKWKKGDYFYPLGMTQKKKVSDFLIDQKIPIIRKESLLILTSKQEICWLVGLRIDDRFRLKNSTKDILRIEMKDLKGNDG
jgi:tRNA(Ile)-lysidine synthase|tara:strand:- start:6 stop:485 length:480 start_codon:yes stop_codon:yes gene_type:complete